LAPRSSTAIIGPEGYAVSRKTRERESIYNILDKIGQAQIIIAEGFRNLKEPTIEVFRRDISEGLCSNLEDLTAVVTDVGDLETSVPKFSINDIKEICDFIECNFLKEE
jgi:molybdopterin-guanine dinucleotide biosynthesis protein MobB